MIPLKQRIITGSLHEYDYLVSVRRAFIFLAKPATVSKLKHTAPSTV
jgi:hypothetical protein